MAIIWDSQTYGHGQNNKFAIFLQYLKKEERDEFNFLHADKHQTFLHVDTTC